MFKRQQRNRGFAFYEPNELLVSSSQKRGAVIQKRWKEPLTAPIHVTLVQLRDVVVPRCDPWTWPPTAWCVGRNLPARNGTRSSRCAAHFLWQRSFANWFRLYLSSAMTYRVSQHLSAVVLRWVARNAWYHARRSFFVDLRCRVFFTCFRRRL